MSPPRAPPIPATMAAVFGFREPSRVPGTAAFALRLTTRLAIGLAALYTSQPISAFRLLSTAKLYTGAAVR
jgi:hypothetical protein